MANNHPGRDTQPPTSPTKAISKPRKVSAACLACKQRKTKVCLDRGMPDSIHAILSCVASWLTWRLDRTVLWKQSLRSMRRAKQQVCIRPGRGPETQNCQPAEHPGIGAERRRYRAAVCGVGRNPRHGSSGKPRNDGRPHHRHPKHDGYPRSVILRKRLDGDVA